MILLTYHFSLSKPKIELRWKTVKENLTIKIPKKSHLKGEDGYKIFSVRIKNETANALEELSAKSNRSRNELIGMILEYAVNHTDITE